MAYMLCSNDIRHLNGIPMKGLYKSLDLACSRSGSKAPSWKQFYAAMTAFPMLLDDDLPWECPHPDCGKPHSVKCWVVDGTHQGDTVKNKNEESWHTS